MRNILTVRGRGFSNCIKLILLLEHSRVEKFATQPVGHWNARNMRSFLEEFAKSRNMDPLLAETWYNIPYQDISQVQGGDSVFQKIKGGYIHTLQQLFPEVKFDNLAFLRCTPPPPSPSLVNVNYSASWHGVENRRQFFEQYALEHGFDPLIPDNWYSQSRESIMDFKVF